MSFFHKKTPVKDYDREHWKPWLRVSICTGEKTAGFKNRTTGEFNEVMRIDDDKDLQDFAKEYGIEEDIEQGY